MTDTKAIDTLIQSTEIVSSNLFEIVNILISLRDKVCDDYELTDDDRKFINHWNLLMGNLVKDSECLNQQIDSMDCWEEFAE